MASQTRLLHLHISLLNENQNLPNFSEALASFKSLHTLHLSNMQYGRLNQNILLSFIKKSNLKDLCLDSINFSDQQFKSFLEQINDSKNLRKLNLSRIHLDTDFKLGLINGFLAGNKNLTQVHLNQNMLNNLEIISQIFINKTMKELCFTQ